MFITRAAPNVKRLREWGSFGINTDFAQSPLANKNYVTYFKNSVTVAPANMLTFVLDMEQTINPNNEALHKIHGFYSL